MAARTATAAAPRTVRDVSAELVFLTRALKAPSLREAVDRLAERARAESWTHEEFLAACLQREVSARESHGGEGRVRAARFPSRKALEESADEVEVLRTPRFFRAVADAYARWRDDRGGPRRLRRRSRGGQGLRAPERDQRARGGPVSHRIA